MGAACSTYGRHALAALASTLLPGADRAVGPPRSRAWNPAGQNRILTPAFWADTARVDACVADSEGRTWRSLIVGSGATYGGLRLLDGTLVLKVQRGNETADVRIIDGAAFDAAEKGFEIAAGDGADARNRWARLRTMDPIFRR